MKPQADEVVLPQTEKEFDVLVRKLVKKFKLPNEEHAAVVVANRIMHMPPDQATVTLEYLGNCVRKNVAYQVASAKGSKISHRVQVDALVANLKANLNDQQSRDALQKAANDGSDYAKEKIAEFFMENIPAEPCEFLA